MSYRFTCTVCDWATPSDRRPPACQSCGAAVEITLETLPDTLVSEEGRYDCYRYGSWLPITASRGYSLGEGWTPLLEAPRLSALGEGASIYVKNETANPTWSWKDRMATMVVSRAVEDGADRIATSTTGNHGSAIAAYASRAGIDRVIVFVNPSSEPPHHAQISAYGGVSIELTDGDASEALLGKLAEHGWFIAYGLDGHFTGQPFVYEGYKTIAYELVEQGTVPDAVVAAVGAGDGLYGVWKGFRELEAAGIIDTTPAMVSAEATERHPLAKSLEAGVNTVLEDPGPEPLNTSTKSATTGEHALSAVRESAGQATVIGRDSLDQALQAVGRDGVFLEPASALAAAGAVEVSDDFETIVAIGSGAGSSWPEKTAEVLGSYPVIEPTIADLKATVPFELE